MEKLSLILANVLETIINNYSDDIAIAIGAGVIALLGYIGSRISNAYVKSAWEKLTIAITVVNQTVVDDLKAATTDGKLTPEEKERVKAHAKEVFMAQFGILGKFITSLIIGNLEKWFNEKAEYIIAEIKKKSSPKPSNG